MGERIDVQRKVNISRVEVTGLDKKLTPTLNLMFKQLNETCYDFNTTLTSLSKIVGRLESFELIKQSEIKLELDKENQGTSLGVPVVVKLNCEPSSKFSLSTGTEFGNQQGSVNTNLTCRNFFNNQGEKLEVSLAYGSKVTSNLQVNVTKPIDLINSNGSLHLNLFQHRTDNSTYQSHFLFQRGAQLLVKNLGLNNQHFYGINLVQRDVEPVKFLTSPAVREASGLDCKLSLLHNYVHDTRDTPVAPKLGNYFRLNQELAGVLGTNQFYKVDLKYNGHYHLGRNFVASLGLHTGLLHPFQKSTHLSDQFSLGGPTSVRGFLTQGLGPSQFRDRIGGNLLMALGISLFTPLPYFTTPRLQGHFFCNAGQLINKSKDQNYGEVLPKLLSQPSTSIGLGLVYHQGIVKLELNYTLPLSTHLNDKLNSGFQLGLGIDYL